MTLLQELRSEVKLAATLTMFGVLLWATGGLIIPVLELSENQTLYIYSSAAQIVAAIFGLTVAGYVFLRNQQDRSVDRDETLAEIFDKIQVRQYSFIAFMTMLSLTSVLVSLIAIATIGQGPTWIHSGTANAATALLVATLLWTGYFIVDALRPGKIDRASKAIKDEVSNSRPTDDTEFIPAAGDFSKQGNLERFLIGFNAIERMLDEFAVRHLGGTTSIEPVPWGSPPEYTLEKRPVRGRWTKARILKALSSQQILPSSLYDELTALVRYRNALVHGQDLAVDDYMINRLLAARAQLERHLYPSQTTEP